MSRLIVPATAFFILFWAGTNVVFASAEKTLSADNYKLSKQITQHFLINGDRFMNKMCEVTADCN